jgi:Fe-S-cluster-containing hydrogenase component 2
MTKIKVIESRCPQNHPCPVVRICPENAISQKDFFSAPEIDQENCANCGKCVRMCGYGAFQTVSENSNN